MRSWMAGMAAGILWVGLWPELPPSALAILLLPGACVVMISQRAGPTLMAGVCLGVLLGWWHGAGLLERRLPAECGSCV